MPYYLPIIVATVLYIVRVSEFFIRRDTEKGRIDEKTSFLLLFLGGTLVTFGSMAEYLFLDRSPSYLLVILGAATFISALVYRNWAIKTLGRFWSVHVEIRDNHELIQSGPFKNVRHPVYSAALLEVIGAVLIFEAYLSSILIVILLFPAILRRIQIEEKELIQKFGSHYKEYIQRTGKLTPKLF